MPFFEYLIILIFAIATAFVACVAILSSSVVSVFAASILGLFVMIVYLIISAPDVAITEAAVGSAISTMFFLVAIKGMSKHLKPKSGVKIDKVEKIKKNIIMASILHNPILMIILIAAVFIGVSDAFIEIGKIQTNEHMESATFYINKTYNETGVGNLVTSVLASYRGFDTLIENLVIMTSAMGVFYILSLKDESQRIVKK